MRKITRRSFLRATAIAAVSSIVVPLPAHQKEEVQNTYIQIIAEEEHPQEELNRLTNWEVHKLLCSRHYYTFCVDPLTNIGINDIIQIQHKAGPIKPTQCRVTSIMEIKR